MISAPEAYKIQNGKLEEHKSPLLETAKEDIKKQIQDKLDSEEDYGQMIVLTVHSLIYSDVLNWLKTYGYKEVLRGSVAGCGHGVTQERQMVITWGKE